MSESPRNIYISFNTSTIIKVFVIAILILAMYYLSDIVLVLLAAIVIASAVEPFIRRVKRKRIPRVLAVLIVYLVLAGVLAGVFVFFLPVVTNETVSFLQNVPRTISLDDLWSPIRDIGFNFGALSSSSTLSTHTISLSDFANQLQGIVAGTGAGAFRTASVFFGGFLSFILILILSFYLAVQEDGVADFLRIITPVRKHEYIIDLWSRSQRKIGFWLQGQILLGVLIGVLVYLTLAVIGIPYALPLALLAALFEIIPVFGPIISSVPAILVAFSTVGVGTALLLVGLYIIIYQFESQLFYPLVVKKIVGVSPIVVILALVIGAKLAGVLGAIIAVPLSAALMEYLHDVEKSKNAEREALTTK